MTTDVHGKVARLALISGAALLFLSSNVRPLVAQPAASPVSVFQAKINEAAVALGTVPRLKNIPLATRQALTEFVVGNMLFVLTHEMGHAVIAEMDLPVLGKEEDAADSFAILSALKIGSDFSHRVLVETAKGWFLTAKRAAKKGESLSFYDEHGLDSQRAYSIVCMMVGSDPAKFKDLADEAKLPQDRQESCLRDYRTGMHGWETILKPHRRGPDQPKAKIDVVYKEGKGDLEVFAQTFQRIGFLEAIAEYAVNALAWKAPLTLEMRSCGEVDTYWSITGRKANVCYELAQEFAQLYRDYGQEQKPSKRTSKTARR